MTGLEKIIKSITDEAESLASQTIDRANNNAHQIIENGKAESDKRAANVIKDAEDESKKIIEKAMSAAVLEKKKRLLKIKQEFIKDLIDEAKNSIIRLPDEDYFTVLLKMIEKFATDQTGEIVFSETDKKRLTNDFVSKLSRVMNFKGGALKISETTRNINGGFILVYGGIEENCSLDALFESVHDRLCDSVNKLLFA